MYMEAGMSEADAKAMAKEVYSKAEAQSPEKVLRIEEVRQNSMTVAYGKASVVLSTADRQEAAEKIAGLGVSPQTAETLVEKAQEIRVDAVKDRIAAVQAQQTDFNTAMNHLTDREERSIDTMIVCSATEPQKHIVVEGGHNGSRVVHDYTVRDGGKQLTAFTDAETTDANGKPVRTEKGTTAWSALKSEMLKASGMDKDAVLTFRSQEEYEQYLSDMHTLDEAGEKPEAPDMPETARSNGHELHPDGNVLDDLHKESPLPEAKPDIPIPDTPDVPDMPKPSPRGARR